MLRLSPGYSALMQSLSGCLYIRFLITEGKIPALDLMEVFWELSMHWQRPANRSPLKARVIQARVY